MLLIPCDTAKSIWKSAETINQEIKDDTSLRVIDGHVTVKSPLVSIRAGPTSQVINRRTQLWSCNFAISADEFNLMPQKDHRVFFLRICQRTNTGTN